ncbi:unnamed protein product [Owenia fusiformis]|uniref:Uncharacterized protein n=1 Tax=Owenia fusiformis TaxID=6347 RepID=A0A8J1XGU3_OWEFU|nr:unnamed protein product [Owenia fusiformis]
MFHQFYIIGIIFTCVIIVCMDFARAQTSSTNSGSNNSNSTKNRFCYKYQNIEFRSTYCVYPCRYSKKSCPRDSVQTGRQEDCHVVQESASRFSRPFDLLYNHDLLYPIWRRLQQQNPRPKTEGMLGCRHVCRKKMRVMDCCDGMWGDQCEDCPQTNGEVCSNRGTCSDGMKGDGTCHCMSGFGGTACEMCKHNNTFGQECSQVCACIHGDCDSGLNGTGKCDCHSGYTGEICDQLISGCANITCHALAKCESKGGKAVCNCKHGYEGNGTEVGGCTPINACERSPCHDKALCTNTGPDMYKCDCLKNYEGDGKYCQPINPCATNHGQCPRNTTKCLHDGPGLHHCECSFGYEEYIDGIGCSLIDICLTNSSDCDKNANCTTVAPNVMSCTCNDGYFGDGYYCYGNILERIKEINLEDTSYAQKLTFSENLFSTVYPEGLQSKGPFTVFVPLIKPYFSDISTSRKLAEFLREREFGQSLANTNIVPGIHAVESLKNKSSFYSLSGTPAQIYVKEDDVRYRLQGQSQADKVTILAGNFQASNGLIHIVDKYVLPTGRDVSWFNSQSKKTLTESIKNDGKYNRFEALLTAAGFGDFLSGTGPYTVLAPNNKAWDRLPKDYTQYLYSPEGKDKLIQLLQCHIMNDTIRAIDLVSGMQSTFTTIGGVMLNVQIQTQGLITIEQDSAIVESDIPASNGIYHHVNGVIMPKAILPLLPSRCDIDNTVVVMGKCGPCDEPLVCRSRHDVSTNKTKGGCRYWGKVGQGQYRAYIGCYVQCKRSYTILKCCPGFFGTDCMPCPGGFKTPCNNNGKCLEGMYSGNGTCMCDVNFRGAACQLCKKDNKFGKNCDQTCTCLHGVCSNGPKGDGLCKPNSCKNGYSGLNCDLQLTLCEDGTRAKLHCHVNAECIVNFKNESLIDTRCQCMAGYRGNGYSCVAINPCLDISYGGCHKQAKCLYTSPGQNKCTCRKGWVGDGTACFRARKCFNSKIHCHKNATCKGRIKSIVGRCVCNDGYHGNGVWCVPTNTCAINNGNCHKKAICTVTGPGDNNCTCPLNYIGDGFTCEGLLGLEISDIPDLAVMNDVIKTLPFTDDYLNDIDSNYTVFAPYNQATQQFLKSMSLRYWTQHLNVLTLLSYHTIDGTYTVSDLVGAVNDTKATSGSENTVTSIETLADGFNINVTYVPKFVRVNDAVILHGDIHGLNGIIHIIDKVLEPYPIANGEAPSLVELLQNNQHYTIFLGYLSRKGLIDKLANLTTQYTLFAPVNSAFNQWNETDSLLEHLDMLYYIVPEVLYTRNLINLTTMELDSLNTDGDSLELAAENNKFYINEVVLVETDMVTDAGVIHGIDGLLWPPEPRWCMDVNTSIHNSSCGPTVAPCPEGYFPMATAMCNMTSPQGVTTMSLNEVTSSQSIMTSPKSKMASLQSESTSSQLMGMMSICVKTIETRKCCHGFSGENCTDPCVGELLVTGPRSVVLDDQITSSSDWDRNHRAANARLHSIGKNGRTSAWSAAVNDLLQWIQVDFHYQRKILAIVIQGRREFDQWVTHYKMAYKYNTTNKTPVFQDYQEPVGIIKEFSANSDRNTPVTNRLLRPFISDVVRIIPTAWHGHISMRFDIEGCFPDCPGDPNNPCSGHGTCLGDVGQATSCQCNPGYYGDNCEWCSDTSHCFTKENLCVGNMNGGCHEDAICSYNEQKNLKRCDCKDGYHGIGDRYCFPDGGVCVINNGGCSQNATCSYTELPEEENIDVACYCNNGFVGNGTLCNADMLDTLGKLNDTQGFYNQLFKSKDSDKQMRDLREQLGDIKTQMTVFAPVSSNLNKTTPLTYADLENYVIEDTIRLETCENNTQITSLSGRTMFIIQKNGGFFLDDIEILERNIPCTNGMLHLLASPFKLPIHHPSSPFSRPIKTSNGHEYGNAALTIGMSVFGVAIILVCVVVLVVLLYKRWKLQHQDEDLQTLINTFFGKRNKDEVSASYTKHQDPTSTTDFENPLYADSGPSVTLK